MNNYLQPIIDAFNRQSRREQVILLVGGFCVSLYALWFLLITPTQQAVVEERQRTAAVSQALSRVQALAVTVRQTEKQQKSSTQKSALSIADVVDRSLRANGLEMRGFQPGSEGEVRLRLDNVPYAQLIQWLYELETTHGVLVKELATSSSSAAGRVMVNVRLRKES